MSLALAPILPKSRNGVPSNRDDPFLAAFSTNLDPCPDEVEIRRVQAVRLREAESCRVKKLKKGAIPQPAPAGLGSVLAGKLEETRHLSLRKVSRQCTALPWCPHMPRRVSTDQPLPVKEAEEVTHARQLTRDGPPFQRAHRQMAQKSPDRQPVHLIPGPPRRPVVAVEEIAEIREVAPVGFDSVSGQLALVPQVSQVPLNLRIGHRYITPAGRCGYRPALAAACSQPSNHARISRSPRSASFCLLSRLPRTCRGSGSRSPKFAFIGWKLLGSASRR